MKDPLGLLLSAMGILCICGAAFDWDWFINSRKARMIVAIAGRTGARILYGVLGTIVAVMGFLMAFGIIETSS